MTLLLTDSWPEAIETSVIVICATVLLLAAIAKGWWKP